MANKTRQRKKAADLGTTSEATTALPTTIESSLPTTTPLVLAETNQFVAIDSSAITTAEQSENTTNSAVTLTEDTPLVVPTVIEQFNNWCLANHQWSVMAEAVVGLTHRDKNLPCQDAVACQTVPRTCLVVCDGAGSSVLSELGANALCQGLTLLCHSLEALWHDLLDNEATNDSLLNTLTRIVLRHAKGIMQNLATTHKREVRDFRSTLLMLVVGKAHLFWLKVGDGALVIEQVEHRYSVPALPTDGRVTMLSTLGELGKGEFANQTTFVDELLKFSDVQFGLQSSEFLTACAAMSDGAAEKLVSLNQRQVAGRVSQWFDALRQQRLARKTLTQAFYSEEFNKHSTGDDRSIALAACGFVG